MTRHPIHSHHSRSRSRQSVTVLQKSTRCSHPHAATRRTISGDVQTIQELFERVATANCVTGTPGNCVAGYSSIDISSSLLSCASTCVSGTNMIDVHVNRSNEHSRAPVRARACIERAAATSRGKTREIRREIGTKNRFRRSRRRS